VGQEQRKPLFLEYGIRATGTTKPWFIFGAIGIGTNETIIH
jgi:hypothetical protein